MARSQDIAGAVALKYLGYKVTLKPIGALISDVASGSPAAKAGLQPTDVIVGVDGKPVATSAQLRSLIGRHKPGEQVDADDPDEPGAEEGPQRDGQGARTAARWSASWFSRQRR